MKQIIAFISLALVAGFANADQTRVFHKNDEAKTIQRFWTYYADAEYPLAKHKQYFKGCSFVSPKQFFKKENLVPVKFVVGVFYCEHQTIVIANDYDEHLGKDD